MDGFVPSWSNTGGLGRSTIGVEELVIKPQDREALGLGVPPSLLAGDGEVIK